MAKVIDLLERKGDISQQGRLIAHIVNELKLTSNTTIRVPLTEALLQLERDGTVTLERRGSVFDALSLVNRKATGDKTTKTETPKKEVATRRKAGAPQTTPVAKQAPVKRPVAKQVSAKAPVLAATASAPATAMQQAFIEAMPDSETTLLLNPSVEEEQLGAMELLLEFDESPLRAAKPLQAIESNEPSVGELVVEHDERTVVSTTVGPMPAPPKEPLVPMLFRATVLPDSDENSDDGAATPQGENPEAEATEPKLTPLQLLTKIVEKSEERKQRLEEVEQDLATEREAHAVTTRQRNAAVTGRSEYENKVRELTSEMGRLQDQLAAERIANGTLETANSRLREELAEAITKAEQAEAAATALREQDGIAALASRVGDLLKD